MCFTSAYTYEFRVNGATLVHIPTWSGLGVLHQYAHLWVIHHELGAVHHEALADVNGRRLPGVTRVLRTPVRSSAECDWRRAPGGSVYRARTMNS